LILGYIAIAVSTSVFLFGHSSALLIIARVCQGVSGAVVGVLSFAIVADTAPPEKRGEYMAFVSISYTWGMISGPVLGGLLYGCYFLDYSIKSSLTRMQV
jgi:MFS family permease